MSFKKLSLIVFKCQNVHKRNGIFMENKEMEDMVVIKKVGSQLKER